MHAKPYGFSVLVMLSQIPDLMRKGFRIIKQSPAYYLPKNQPYYIVRFIAWVCPDGSDSVYKELLITDISIGITSKLAVKSGNLFSNHAGPSLSVYIALEISEEFIITKTGSNYTAQTVDVPRLLECWEALGFPLCIDTTKFNLYKSWAIGSDVEAGIPKNL